MVYVDNMRVSHRGKEWCHLMADGLDELHAFAKKMNIDPRLFHRTASYPHYDVTVQMRELILQFGAVQADRKTIIACGKKLKAELLALEFQHQKVR
ncbi:DUF4031 domain-containing protein [Acinetobacter sp. 194]|nr:DUF4031 domain-containing protein [Acinetobacter shaoyimingii]